MGLNKYNMRLEYTIKSQLRNVRTLIPTNIIAGLMYCL